MFGGVTFQSEEELYAAWEDIKKREKQGRQWQGDYLKGAFGEANDLIDHLQEIFRIDMDPECRGIVCLE